MTPCSTLDCPNTATWISTDRPPQCDICRIEARLEARAADRASACTHLVRVEDPWLRDYGTPEGQAGWLDRQWQTYSRVLSGPNQGKPRTEKQARSAALRHWRQLRDESLRNRLFARRCELGYDCRPTQRILDTDARGGVVRHHLSVVTCDRQDSCRAYEPVPANDGEATAHSRQTEIRP